MRHFPKAKRLGVGLLLTTNMGNNPVKFLLISASDRVRPRPVEVNTLEELLSYIGYIELGNELIVSRRSLVDKAHDRIQDKEKCKFVLCVYDDFIE